MVTLIDVQEAMMGNNDIGTLQQHLTEVKEGKRRFENAFQAVSRKNC